MLTPMSQNASTAEFQTILYSTQDRVATITLNRPEQLNTIIPPMPDEVEAAVSAATRDPEVSVIVLRGAGRSFCGGYNFGSGFHHWDDLITTDGEWDAGKDFVFATAPQLAPTQKFLGLEDAEAGDRASARLVCGRRQRLRLVRRPGNCQ